MMSSQDNASADEPQVRRAFAETATVFQSLATVRSRRVGHGYRIDSGTRDPHPVTGRPLAQQSGPLSFVSQRSEPLSQIEEALLCWAACGPNGMVAWDISSDGGFNQLGSVLGRTAPEPNNTRATDLLVIADHGSYLYRPACDPTAVSYDPAGELTDRVVGWYTAGSIRLSEGRPDVDWAMRDPRAPGAPLNGPPQANMNRPGSLWLLPVADVAYLHSGLVDLFATRRAWIADDFAGDRPAGVEQWVKNGKLQRQVFLSVYEQDVLMNETYPAGCMVQNVRLAAEALGLGTWCFSGHDAHILLGGRPDLSPGLGFEFQPTNPKAPVATGRLKCEGLPGIKDATLVPSRRYPDGRAVVDQWYQERHGATAWGGAGENNAIRNGRTPWRADLAEAFLGHPHALPPDWAWEATAAYIDYCAETHGQWPVTYDPIQAGFGVTVHHVDTGFYDDHYRPGLITDRIRWHHQTWHPDRPG